MKPPVHVLTVCKIGQRANCCRYLLMGPDGWECGRLDPTARAEIDARVEAGQFMARGKNCDGIAKLNEMPNAEDIMPDGSTTA